MHGKHHRGASEVFIHQVCVEIVKTTFRILKYLFKKSSNILNTRTGNTQSENENKLINQAHRDTAPNEPVGLFICQREAIAWACALNAIEATFAIKEAN